MKKEYIKPVLKQTDIELVKTLLSVESLHKGKEEDDEVNGEDALAREYEGWQVFD
ncbi:MAG: hypothetical protein HUK01_10425 [Bacteroidaceae bacterium]|nr:hypothetical protein [Bacteroidaceae bacterium]